MSDLAFQIGLIVNADLLFTTNHSWRERVEGENKENKFSPACGKDFGSPNLSSQVQIQTK